MENWGILIGPRQMIFLCICHVRGRSGQVHKCIFNIILNRTLVSPNRPATQTFVDVFATSVTLQGKS